MTDIAASAPGPSRLRERLQEALAGAYRVERELGGGAMARVFVAEETALGRKVVIKVLAPEIAHELSGERFTREVQVAARLQQANIVPVLNAGRADGLSYYTMPYVRGESLRARMTAGATMPLAEAVGVLRDVAKALAYAHGEGVVHRDIKPENVLLSGGTAVVTDFGIAKAIRAAMGGPDRREPPEGARDLSTSVLTQMGTSLGTPAYMAPEQAAGDPDVDHRADLYAWGVMAYELLSGRHPFADRRTVQALITAHFIETPAPLVQRAPDVPAHLAELVGACLAKDPHERLTSATALLAALDHAPARGGPALARPATAAAAAAEPAIAVLPFANLSSDPENEYLSDGITDEIIGTLGRQRGVRVAGRASCFALKGQQLDAPTVGARLGVTCIVEGTLRRAGNRIRVSVELVDATDGFQRWSERYDRDLTDVFAVQDEIAQAIAGALTDRLVQTDPAAGAASHTAAEPEAYRLYLLGMHALRNQSTASEFEQALDLVERAVGIDPTLARAHVARAVIYNVLPIYSIRSARNARPKAREAARAALALDDRLAEAWAVEAEVSYGLEWDWPNARTAFSRALTCDPNDSGTLARAAVFHAASGEPETAVSLANRAMLVDPLSAWTHFLAATTFRLLRRYDEALAASNVAVELNPRHGRALSGRGQLLLLRGDLDGALGDAERAVALTEQSPLAVMTLGAAHAARGDRERAEACLDGMLRRHDAERPAAIAIGLMLAALGRHAEAVHWLQEAAVAREPWATWLGAEPLADSLRGDPRFQALLRRMGVPGT